MPWSDFVRTMRRSPSTRRRVVLRTTARVLAVVASLALLVRVMVSGRDGLVSATVLAWQQQPAAVGAIAALTAAWLYALAEVQRSSVRALGADLSRRDAFRISRAAFTLSRVIPGGGAAGGVFAVRELHRLGHHPGVAGGTAVVSWAACSIVFAVAAVGAAALTLAGDHAATALVVPGVAVAVGLGGTGAAVLWAVHDPRARQRLVIRLAPRRAPRSRVRTWIARGRSLAATAIGDLDRLGAQVGRPSIIVGWAGVALTLEFAVLWAVFTVVGATSSLGVLAAGFLSASLLNALPEVTPGWIGVYETAMTATYVALGVPLETAVVAVLLHRLVAFWLPVVVGILPATFSLAAGRRTSGRRPAPRRPAARRTVEQVA